MKAGIYQIRNTVNESVYIGKSADIEKRWEIHRYELQRGTHHNSALQQDWIVFGETCFEFTVLEYIRKNGHLGAAERRWVSEKLETTNVYNSLRPLLLFRREQRRQQRLAETAAA